VPVALVELSLEPVLGGVAELELFVLVPESVLVLGLVALGVLELLSFVLGEVVVLGAVVVFESDDLPVFGWPLLLGLVVDGLPGLLLSVPVPLVCA